MKKNLTLLTTDSVLIVFDSCHEHIFPKLKEQLFSWKFILSSLILSNLLCFIVIIQPIKTSFNQFISYSVHSLRSKQVCGSDFLLFGHRIRWKELEFRKDYHWRWNIEGHGNITEHLYILELIASKTGVH